MPQFPTINQVVYKDFDTLFDIHPVTRKLNVLTNVDAVARSVKNLVLTHLEERPFNPILGSRISASLFELMDVGSASIIADEIRNTIDNFEPRVKLVDVEVTPYYDSHIYDVVIVYDIVGIPAATQQVNFILESLR